MARRTLLTALIALLCGAPAVAAQELTVYSSLPLQGASEAQTAAIVAGARRALSDAGGQAGGRPIRYVSLDDSTAQAGTWTPKAVSRNARRAARDPSAIAYLGEFNSGASAISLPILNVAGLLQVSPSNTAVGLTTNAPGADAGEPEKYYPTGKRNYGRVVPTDVVQGRAGAALLKQLGAKRVVVFHDREVYGRGVARVAARTLRKRGVRVIAVRGINPRAISYRRLARLARRADGVYFGGITANNAVQLFKDVTRANRRAVKVGSDGIADSRFADPSQGGIPRSVARRTYVTVATLDPAAYPPAGQALLASLGPNTDPYALYGYEAMAVILDSINRGGPTRAGALAAFFATRDRDSVLGRYSIDQNGDTTLTQYGAYRIRGGALRFDRAVDAGP